MGTRMSRREWLQRSSSVAATCSFKLPFFYEHLSTSAGQNPPQPPKDIHPPIEPASANLFPVDPTKYKFSAEEEAFLEEVQRACFGYFWETVNPATGLVKDRSLATGIDARTTASIAATGFGLTALCIADRRGWADKKEILKRVRNTLRFTGTQLTHEHGFYFHFLDMHTGDRVFHSELSSIDTALFLCGVLTCQAYFEDPEIRTMAAAIYEAADWPWLLQGGKTISMGWKPEGGFLKTRWDSYSELMMIYLLGLGSTAHPLPAETWDAWARTYFEFNGIRYIGAHAPLFVHQFSHAWFDFRGKRDKYADYFTNSVIATKVHKLWCLELAEQFPDYSENLWGVSASDSSRGYTAWGGPPTMGRIDGSIVPCAAGGSLPFLPQETLQVLRTIREKYNDRTWRKYGFVDAFNPLTNWNGPDVVGIDAGITLVMAENARTGFVWEQFMKNEAAKRGMARAGFHEAAADPGNTPQAPKDPKPGSGVSE